MRLRHRQVSDTEPAAPSRIARWAPAARAVAAAQARADHTRPGDSETPRDSRSAAVTRTRPLNRDGAPGGAGRPARALPRASRRPWSEAGRLHAAPTRAVRGGPPRGGVRPGRAPGGGVARPTSRRRGRAGPRLRAGRRHGLPPTRLQRGGGGLGGSVAGRGDVRAGASESCSRAAPPQTDPPRLLAQLGCATRTGPRACRGPPRPWAA